MKIIRFTANNVKRLEAVEITPDGNLVILGGKNCAGKSSVLDSILVALMGKKYADPKMLREGAKNGFVELDCGDFTVKRTFTEAGGGTLVVSNKDGAKYSSPQSMLDGLIGKISFDPLEFARLDVKKQVEVLKEVIGVDFDAIDSERQQLYDNRTEVNRKLTAIKAEAESIKNQLPEKLPEKRLSINDLMEELKVAENNNSNNWKERKTLKELDKEIADDNVRLEDALVKLAEINTSIHNIKEHLNELNNCRNEQAEVVKKLQDTDVASIKDTIRNAEAVNSLYDKNIKVEDLRKQYSKLNNDSKMLTEKISQLDIQKEDAIKNADLPIDGLTFDKDGVLYKGLPFQQASSAEKLRVSTALAIKMNANLRVLLIRDGSLLDVDNLAMIAKMAEDSNSQIWIERVGDQDKMAVILEDGHVRGED